MYYYAGTIVRALFFNLGNNYEGILDYVYTTQLL